MSRVTAVVALSFSSGLPLGLVRIAIPDWMRSIGIDLRVVGLFTLAQAPSFKLLWSPLMDREPSRRGWARDSGYSFNVRRLEMFWMRILTIGAWAVLLSAASAAAQPPVDKTKVGTPAASAAVTSGGTLTSLAPATAGVLDDFNRPDGPIGSAWTVHDGSCNVVGNAASCGSVGRATFNGAPGGGLTAEADVATNGTSLQYTGLLLSYGAGSSNVFIKVQQQNEGGQFDHGACYTGNNGGSFGLGFFAFSETFATAHLKAARVGDVVTIELTNVDGGTKAPQTYVCAGAPPVEGTGVGIHGYAGIARIDNFAVAGAAAGEAVIPALGPIGLAALTLLLAASAVLVLRRPF